MSLCLQCDTWTWPTYFLCSFQFSALIFSKTSKSQAKKQKVAKKQKGEEGADPYDFESDEEEQDTGGELKATWMETYIAVIITFFFDLVFI